MNVDAHVFFQGDLTTEEAGVFGLGMIFVG